MKVVISGSRYAQYSPSIKEFVDSLRDDTVIYHGGCRGVDTIVDRLARARGLKVIVKYPNWDKYGNAAGPIRNRELLDENPDIVILFHEDITKSKGTLDVMKEAKKRGIPYKYIQLI